MPAARTKVVLIVCALFVVPGYQLPYREQPHHGRGKHRMCTAITLTSAHSISHSLFAQPVAAPAIPDPLACPVLRRRLAQRENLQALAHRRKVLRKPAYSHESIVCRIVGVCQA